MRASPPTGDVDINVIVRIGLPNIFLPRWRLATFPEGEGLFGVRRSIRGIAPKGIPDRHHTSVRYSS